MERNREYFLLEVLLAPCLYQVVLLYNFHTSLKTQYAHLERIVGIIFLVEHNGDVGMRIFVEPYQLLANLMSTRCDGL